jgi:hypothetical protein
MKIKTRLKARIKEIQKIKGKQTKRAERATEKTLKHFGAIIRQDARKLIGAPAKGVKFSKQIVDGKQVTVMKPGPPPRPAGKPPRARNSQEGANLRTIVYDVDKEKRSVRIGVMKLSGMRTYGGKTQPEIHEFGATVTVKVVRVRSTLTKENLKKKKGQMTQVSSSMILLESSRGGPMPMKMPKRPFMHPAFERHKKNATKIWKEYYKASRGR